MSFAHNFYINYSHEVCHCVVFYDVYIIAFDTVPHLSLLQTMETLGLSISSVGLETISSNKTQFVVVDGCTSLTLSVISGVPQ